MNGDLIIGAFSYYDWKRVEAFAVSARKHCPNARCMAVGILAEETARKLVEAGFELFEHDWLLDYSMLYIHPNNGRWWPIADALRRTKARRVFLSDTRDVVFQGDVFEHTPEYGILSPMEGQKVGESEPNKKWLELFLKRTGKPLRIMEQSLGWEVSCCGTLLGSMDDMRWYSYQMVCQLTLMLRELNRVSDQAIHNWLMHCEAPHRFQQSWFSHRVFATMSPMPHGVVYETVAQHVILHQYEQRPNVRYDVYEQLGLDADPRRWSKDDTVMVLSDTHGWWP